MSDDFNLVFLPDIHVQVALASDNVIDQLDSFILDDPVNGVLDSGTLGLSGNWTDITEFVRSFSVNRLSTREQGPLWTFQAGTCSVVLDNSTGDFDPDNGSSIFASGGVNQLTPMTPVRIFAGLGGVNYGLYLGYADGWLPETITYQGDYTTITLSATDAFKVLSGRTLPEISIEGVSADTGARVTDILSRVGWYTSAQWANIDTGNSTMQGTTLGSDALSLIQLATVSEIGRFFVDGNGAVTLKSRHSLLTDERSNSVVAVFGDTPGTVHEAGTELSCSSITRASDDTTLVNDVQATRTGGTLQEVTDTASVAKYLFPRSYERSDLILESDTETLSWAQWVSYIGGSGENRFESITIDPQADSDTLWRYVLDARFGDRIQIWDRPGAFGGPLNANPYFKGGSSSGWSGFNGTFSVTSSPPGTAPYPYAGQFTITTASAGAAAEESGDDVPVNPLTSYTLWSWVYTSTGSVTMGFDWRDSSGSYLSSSTETISVPVNTWTEVSTTQTSPSGAASGYERIAPLDGVGNSIYLVGAAIGNPVVKDCFITGLQIDADLTTRQWTSTWTFQDASKYGSFLTLDNPTTGKLDSNALAF